MLTQILDIPQRKIFYVTPQNDEPAAFLIIDDKAGGILINTPAFSDALLKNILELTPLNFIFLPSKFGAQSLKQWKIATNAESIAHEIEASSIDSPIDITVNHKTKLTRTMDFVPMAGRTKGSCALFLKNLPGVLFLGPTLSTDKSGWPALVQQDDDASFETRMFGVLGLKELKYDYVFTDDFRLNRNKFGPSASTEVTKNITRFFE